MLNWKKIRPTCAKSILILCLVAISISLNAQLKLAIIDTRNTSCGYANGFIFVQASGGKQPYTFFDNGLPSTNGAVFSNLSSGIHLIRVTDANGISRTSSVTLTNNFPHPVITTTTSTPPSGCGILDGSITFDGADGTPPYLYSVTGGVPITGNTFMNLSAGNYSLLILDKNGCSISKGFNLPDKCVVSSAVSITTANSTCGEGGSITINPKMTGANNYTFSLNGSAYSTSAFTNLVAGAYTLNIKDINTNQISTTRVIVGNQCPFPINTTTTPSRCNAQTGTISIDYSGGSKPLFYSIEGQDYSPNNTIVDVPSGTHTVKIIDANGTIATKSDVTVGEFCPSATANTTPSACSANTGSITVNNVSGLATPLKYSKDGLVFQSNNVFTNVAPGNYTIIVLDRNGIGDTLQNVNVLTSTGPSISVSQTPSGCTVANGSITATVSGGESPYKYRLSNGQSNLTGKFNSLIFGNYSVSATDKNGCSTSIPVVVQTSAKPTLSLSATDAGCSGNDGSITSKAGDGLAPYQYALGNGPFQKSGFFGNLAPDDYVVNAVDANGCSAIRGITISVKNSINVNAGPDTTICEGATLTLSGQISSGSYRWTPSGNNSDSQSLHPTVKPDRSTIYSLTANSGLCSGSDSVLVTVTSLPISNAGKDQTICFDTSAQLSGSGGIKFSWTPSNLLDDPTASNPKIKQVEKSTTYYLVVTDENGCQSNPDSVEVIAIPKAIIYAGNDTSVLKGEQIKLHASDVNNSGFIKYTWSPSFDLDNSLIQDPILTANEAVKLTVIGSTRDNCTAADDIYVTVFDRTGIFVPNAFTPNNDGINDILRIKTIGIRNFQYFRVFNRFGQIVFQTANPSNGWDGKINGINQPTGGYVWVADGTDINGKPIHPNGTVIIIR